MERTITGYHQDDEDDWVAELSCGHNQHVRHRPPFQLRPWVLDPAGRTERTGTPLDCPLCDRAEFPECLHLVRSSPEWNEHTIPPGLLRAHHLASGTWGRVVVREGRLRFVASTEPPIDVVLEVGSSQAIPPDLEHHVTPIGTVRFIIDFLAIDEKRCAAAPQDPELDARPQPPDPDEGGDPACWAGVLCPECGAVLDGGPHRQGCVSAAGLDRSS